MKILNNFIGNKYKLNNHINVIKKIYKKGFFQNDCIFYILNNDILLIIDKYLNKYDPRSPNDLYNTYKNKLLNETLLPLESNNLNYKIKDIFDFNSLKLIVCLFGDTKALEKIINNSEYCKEVLYQNRFKFINLSCIICTFYCKNKQDSFEIFKKLYIDHNFNNFIIDSDNRNLFHYAAETNNYLIFNFLLNLELNPFKLDNNQNLPIHLASRKGNLEIIYIYNSLGYNLKPGYKIDDEPPEVFGDSCLVLLYFGLLSSGLENNWFFLSTIMMDTCGNFDKLSKEKKNKYFNKSI